MKNREFKIFIHRSNKLERTSYMLNIDETCISFSFINQFYLLKRIFHPKKEKSIPLSLFRLPNEFTLPTNENRRKDPVYRNTVLAQYSFEA